MGGGSGIELEPEHGLIQIHMAQKQLLWVEEVVEVDAHAVRKRLGRDGVVLASAGVAYRACVCYVFGASWAVWCRYCAVQVQTIMASKSCPRGSRWWLACQFQVNKAGSVTDGIIHPFGVKS